LFDNTKTAIVVGAGISGLSCALELEKSGYRVQILEKEKHPGERVHSDIIASSSYSKLILQAPGVGFEPTSPEGQSLTIIKFEAIAFDIAYLWLRYPGTLYRS